jgi:hypothetical protein
MRILKAMFERGVKEAFAKFALGPPTQVDQFMADVESGKDVQPDVGLPPMSHAPGEALPALDGTTPLSTSPPTPQDTIGSTVGQPPLAGLPGAPPPSMGMLGG